MNPRSFGYAIRTGLISAFAMRLNIQNKRKVFGDYKSLYSKRSDNISARTGFLLNYGLQGINAILLKGNFVKERNYYEDFVDYYKWW